MSVSIVKFQSCNKKCHTLCMIQTQILNISFQICVTDDDECQTGQNTCIKENGECINTEGGYTCRCKSGYEERNGECEGKTYSGPKTPLVGYYRIL